MAKKVKVRKIGNSLGVTLPKEMLNSLHVREGDVLYVVESKDGLQLRPYDPNFEKAMEYAEETMRKYRDDLRDLAK